MELVNSLDLSYEEICFKQLERLNSEVSQELYHKKRKDNRLFKSNVYDDVAPRKKQDLDKALVEMLRTIGKHILRHFNELSLAWSPINSPTSGRTLFPAQAAGRPLRLVNRREKKNFAYDKFGVIKMKSVDEIILQSVTKSRAGLILHIIANVMKLIEADTFMTKRELYYKSQDFCRVRPKTHSSQNHSNSTQNSAGICTQNTSQRTAGSQPSLGRSSQSQVCDQVVRYSTTKLDNAIDDLCCFVGCSRVHLRILTQSKGLVYGNIKFRTKNGEFYDCLRNEGVLIPTPQSPIVELASDAKLIIVLEKDSVMQKIVNRESTIGFCKRFKAILFTGKGYPDINSRAFLNYLWKMLQVPVLALTDADPQGLEIICCYKFGCYSTAYESAHVTVPHIKWLGFLPDELMRLNLHESKVKSYSKIDVSKLNSLMERPYLKDRKKWFQQLQLMRSLQKKAELESLDICGDYLVTSYLPNKIRYASWL